MMIGDGSIVKRVGANLLEPDEELAKIVKPAPGEPYGNDDANQEWKYDAGEMKEIDPPFFRPGAQHVPRGDDDKRDEPQETVAEQAERHGFVAAREFGRDTNQHAD